jgi:hypothetical protein
MEMLKSRGADSIRRGIDLFVKAQVTQRYECIRTIGIWLTNAERPLANNLSHSCLRNVVALFHVIEKELEWRKSRGQLEGFETMIASKPIVAVGADHPLEDEILMADYFRMQLRNQQTATIADLFYRWS